jgi:hypothetical protein
MQLKYRVLHVFLENKSIFLIKSCNELTNSLAIDNINNPLSTVSHLVFRKNILHQLHLFISAVVIRNITANFRNLNLRFIYEKL